MLEVRQVDKDPGVKLLQLELHLAVLERVVAVLAHALGPAVQVLEPVRVGLPLRVLQHLVAGDVGRVPEGVRANTNSFIAGFFFILASYRHFRAENEQNTGPI